MAEIAVLGQLAFGSGTRPNPDRFRALEPLLVVKTKSDARRTYGYLQYHRRLLPSFSRRAKILSDAAAPRTPLVWTPAHAALVRELYEEIKSASLAHFDPTRKTRVYSDGCALGIAGEIWQGDETNRWRPFAFHSRLTTPSERTSWPAAHIELLACAETLTKYRAELMLVEFELLLVMSQTLNLA